MQSAAQRSVAAAASALLAITLLAGLIGNPVAGASPRKIPVTVAPITGFGGYTSSGNVDSIAAQWRVPTVSSGSPVGMAATWIGAQNTEGPGFIQVGTTETANRDGVAGYEVFWSDDTLGYHPKYFGRSEGGDLLSVSMRRVSSGWKLAVHDETSGAFFAKTVGYDPGVRLVQGEWVQEDPVSSDVTARDSPYPRTSTVGFEDVKLNGATPDLRLKDGQTLVTSDNEFLVPTPFSDDGFRLLPAQGFARQYLLDATPFNWAADAFNVEWSSWSSDKARTRLVYAQRLITALDNFAGAIKRGQWPATARSAMLRVVRVADAGVVTLASWARVGAPLHGNAYRAERTSDQLLVTVTKAARATLGLPPP